MVRFIPYEKFIIKTSFSSDEIKQKLSEIIEPARTFRYEFSSKYKPYEGEVDGDNFKINKTICYGRSGKVFSPIIKGKIQGSSLEVIIRLDWFAEIFIVFFLGVWGLLTLSVVFTKQAFTAFNSIPIVMFVSMYLLWVIQFNSDVIKSKRFLCNLLESEII